MLGTMYLAGGCFWGLEEYFRNVTGVVDTEVGYANSVLPNPSYEQVCAGAADAAETVAVTYDTDMLQPEDLFRLLLAAIDPFSVNRQGNDVGSQYRSGIYTTDDEQFSKAVQFVREQEDRLGKPLAVQVMPLKNFYPAEEYHQKYLCKNPRGYCHIGKEAFEHARSYKVSEAR